MSHEISILPLVWSCGPAQAVALFAVPYNLGYIAKRKVQLAHEQQKLEPSVEKIKQFEKEIYRAWVAIEFHKDASRPLLGTIWEIEGYWKKKGKQTDLMNYFSQNIQTIETSIQSGDAFEKELTALFLASAPRSYNPNLKKFNELKDQTFDLIKRLQTHQIPPDKFEEDWAKITQELKALDLS